MNWEIWVSEFREIKVLKRIEKEKKFIGER